MPKLDHLSVIAPSLEEGVSHVRKSLGVDIPFGRKHTNMSTHNHLIKLGDTVYLEIIAIDEDVPPQPYPRWFGLDNHAVVRSNWDQGRRLRGWVASTDHFEQHMAKHALIYGEKREFKSGSSSYFFAVPRDGALPMDGMAPSLIDRRGKKPSMPSDADVGCKLVSFSIKHPEIRAVKKLYQTLEVAGSPEVKHGESLHYIADIATPSGIRTLF